MVTLPAEALGVLIACGEGSLAVSIHYHAEEGRPLPDRLLGLIDALDAAEAAIMGVE